MTIRAILMLTTVVLVSVVIFIFGAVTYTSGDTIIRKSIQNRLDAIATNQRDRIENVINAWQDRTILIASRTQLRISTENYIRTADPGSLARVHKIISDAQQSVQAVHSIEIATINGQTITKAAGTGMPVLSEILFTATDDDVRINKLLITADGHRLVEITAPMLLNGKQIGRTIVVLVADELIAATTDYTGLGETGETLLAAVDFDNNQSFLTPLRHEPKQNGLIENVDVADNSPMQRIFEGPAGFFEELRDYRGEPVWAVGHRLTSLGWGVVVKMDRKEILAPLKQYRIMIFSGGLILILLALFTSFRIAQHISRPIEALAKDAQKILSGQHDLRADETSNQAKEIKTLSVSFNQLANGLLKANANLEQQVDDRTQDIRAAHQSLVDAMDKLYETQLELINSEKMAALGDLVAGVAHEINTPLGICVTGTSYLKEEISEIKSLADKSLITKGALDQFIKNADKSCDLMHTHLERAALLIANFKEIAVDQSNPDIRTIKVSEYLDKVVGTLQPKFKPTPHTVSIKAPADLKLKTCPGALSQALTALLSNCLVHAFDRKQNTPGEITISANNHPNGVLLQVQDNGAGVSYEHLNKIFEPFFTTKRDSGGSGLGLSIVHNIVTEILQGKITCESTLGEGTCFSMILPPLTPQKTT